MTRELHLDSIAVAANTPQGVRCLAKRMSLADGREEVLIDLGGAIHQLQNLPSEPEGIDPASIDLAVVITNAINANAAYLLLLP